MSVFVDTSAWYAAADRSDRNNARAKEILTVSEPRITSDHVLIETWLLLRYRINRNAAERFWENLRGGIATIEPITSGDLTGAWAIEARFPDQDFSVVDRTSFALMERLGLTRVASFDRDFSIYRYGRRLDRAFTVLR